MSFVQLVCLNDTMGYRPSEKHLDFAVDSIYPSGQILTGNSAPEEIFC